MEERLPILKPPVRVGPMRLEYWRPVDRNFSQVEPLPPWIEAVIVLLILFWWVPLLAVSWLATT